MATSKMKHKRIPAAEFVEMQNQLHQLTATGLDVKSARDRIAQQHGADPASFDKRMKRYAQDSLRATSTSNNAASPNATSISAQQELCLLYLIDVTSAIHEPMKKSDFIAFVQQTLIPEQRREHWRGGQWFLHFLNRNNKRIRLSDIKVCIELFISFVKTMFSCLFGVVLFRFLDNHTGSCLCRSSSEPSALAHRLVSSNAKPWYRSGMPVVEFGRVSIERDRSRQKKQMCRFSLA